MISSNLLRYKSTYLYILLSFGYPNGVSPSYDKDFMKRTTSCSYTSVAKLSVQHLLYTCLRTEWTLTWDASVCFHRLHAIQGKIEGKGSCMYSSLNYVAWEQIFSRNIS
jgi:hypothetical protein